MCDSRGKDASIEKREPTSGKRPSRNEPEQKEAHGRAKGGGIITRAKTRLASLLETPGENGRQEPEPTMRIGTWESRIRGRGTNKTEPEQETDDSVRADD
ncbi:hypothetical protein [Haladaptatus caseinilyticus]|uniref:hypothetical protein n=1 Tax=Haladaptatus caseinilyticus TaxID=2993314 RepID=UPI00224ADBBC|nr:hypothetical protein [Haladaptatus caseinilyticus]